MADVIEKLLETKPNFHLGEQSYSIGLDSLRWIRNHVCGVSIETGAGWSTCVLAEASEVITIDPTQETLQLIDMWLGMHAPELRKCVQFMNTSSLEILPNLPIDYSVDFVLIDGLHAFPAPIIDWYYASQYLRVGGYVMLDDLSLWSVAILARYLQTDKSWKLVWSGERSSCFELIAPFEEPTSHVFQQFVMDRSPRAAKLCLGNDETRRKNMTRNPAGA